MIGWYRNRSRTGHPEKAGRIGRTDYWYDDDWTAWHQAHQRAKTESLTRVDREGDPDDLVDAAEVARMMGYARRNVIHANRRLGYFPEPDAYGTTARGRRAPLWKRSTVGLRPTGAPASGGLEVEGSRRHDRLLWRSTKQSASPGGRPSTNISPKKAM